MSYFKVGETVKCVNNEMDPSEFAKWPLTKGKRHQIRSVVGDIVSVIADNGKWTDCADCRFVMTIGQNDGEAKPMNFELLDAARNFRSLLRSASVENLERLHLKLANDADGSDFDLHLDGLLGAIQGEMKRRVVRAKDDA